MSVSFATILLIAISVYYVEAELPDYHFLTHYQPKALNRIITREGCLIKDYAAEKRIFVSIETVPPLLIDAFLVAEDKNFFKHPGIDFISLGRAFLINLWRKNAQGASTITQQLAKNLLIGNEHSYKRKIKEAILALRMEVSLSKKRILELYLNQIFLGHGAYGVAAAAYVYFKKTLWQLTPDEIAFLATLPKAPSYYTNKGLVKAEQRRNCILKGMYEQGFLNEKACEKAISMPIRFRFDKNNNVPFYYCAEDVKRELVERIGGEAFKQGGFLVKTTLHHLIQKLAYDSLRRGLQNYDRRQQGWRGPIAHLSNLHDWDLAINKIVKPKGITGWNIAVLLKKENNGWLIGLPNKDIGYLSLKDHSWLPLDKMQVGDVVSVSHLNLDAVVPLFQVEQVPEVAGGIIVMDARDGKILANVGGFDFDLHQYSMATQAKRQIGSLLKPFVYLTALEKGYSKESIFIDEPIKIFLGGQMGWYEPKNHNQKYEGPLPLKNGLIYSKNSITIRIAQAVGMRSIAKLCSKFGIYDHLPLQFAAALGSYESTLLKMVAAYGMIANGGKVISPHTIEEIQNRYGQTVYHALSKNEKNIKFPSKKIINEIKNILKDVVRFGTAHDSKMAALGVAGKTGTTNDSKDAWFIGFKGPLVVGVFVGHLTPKPMKGGGASIAYPIFKSFIRKAMHDPSLASMLCENNKSQNLEGVIEKSLAIQG